MRELDALRRVLIGAIAAAALAAAGPAAAVQQPDVWITTKVKADLMTSEGLGTVTAIDVDTVDGRVTLHGTVPSPEARTEAERVARTTEGVREVRNLLEVRPKAEQGETGWRQQAADETAQAEAMARDAYITSATKLRLLANSQTPGFDVNVDTRDGVVTLFGTVPSEAAKTAAEAEAKKADGVQRVVNALQVVPPEEAESVARSDAQLDEAIERRLDASQRLAESDIGVAVENGVARLTGSVASSSDQVTALTLARSTQGVRRVIDDLEVEPPAVGSR